MVTGLFVEISRVLTSIVLKKIMPHHPTIHAEITYRKVLKYSGTPKICCNCPKI